MKQSLDRLYAALAIRDHRVYAFGLCLLLAGAVPAHGYIDGPKALVPERYALADCVVVGQITAVEEKPVVAGAYGGMARVMKFNIAEAKVRDVIRGDKNMKTIRLGFLNVAPKVGQDGCFFAIKHSDQDFYVVPGPGPFFLERTTADYEKELARTRHCARLMEEPSSALKSDKAEDRFLTAYLLLYSFNWAPIRKPAPGVKLKAEPIDPEQSKRLMTILADADWSKPDSETGASPKDLLYLITLGLSRTGTNPPRALLPVDGSIDAIAARKWLRENSDSYRLQQLVPAR